MIIGNLQSEETTATVRVAPEPKPKYSAWQKEVIVINLVCVLFGIVLSLLVAFEVAGPKPGAAMICFLTAFWGFGIMRAARLF